MVEKRLIDANALYDKVEQKYKVSSGSIHSGYREFLDMICDAPTVDAVEAVRCKDCGYGGLCGAEIACNHPAYAQNEGVWSYDPEFFCAYGERRADEKV